MNKKDFSFTGSGDEYFKIWIVNILLSIVTLGIYSAWATVRTKRYFYGNTVLDENNFEYHAKPMQILIGRIIAMGLLIAYVILSEIQPFIGMGLIVIVTLSMPWLIMRSLKFNARMSSYRNVRFSFTGSTLEAYKAYLIIPLFPLLIGGLLAALLHFIIKVEAKEVYTILGGLTLLCIFLLVPFVETLTLRYQFNNLKYGQGQFFTKIDAKPIYMIYLKLVGIVVACYAVIGLIAAAFMFFNDKNTQLSDAMMVALVVLAIPAYISLILFGIFTKAFLQSKKRNYLFSKTGLDNTLLLESGLKPWSLFKLLATNLLLVMLTLGFAKPWIAVRTQRHILDHTHAKINGDLGQYVSKQQEMNSSFGDEMGEAFDLEAGFEVGI